MVFFGRSLSFAALALCSSSLAAPTAEPRQESFNTLLGYPEGGVTDGISLFSAPEPEYVTLSRETLANLNATEASAFEGPFSALAQRDVIGGRDDRVLWRDRNYPYSAVGKIQWSNGVWCSGTLIGPRHVATAKHCAPGSGTSVSIRFSPSFFDGEVAGGSYVTHIIALSGFDVNDNPDSCDWKEDWAVFILQDRIGNSQGYFGAKLIEDSHTSRPIFYNMGYPGDRDNGRFPYRSEGSTVRSPPYGCDAYGPYITDTDVAGGQSGGPFWLNEGDGPYLYAICSGSSSANSIFSGGNNFLQAVINTRNDFP
ncbi:hypothetical protein DL764_000624 [Monosporascus ibericus]|uniref:Serine protease n=1 Tax=Monosporascus ibericus TaxID=155417 RepID=A0A4Q4TSR9_9PEZI|nr:hypothetical protein DL764_000624 [Monosporascus ibericus]